MRFNISGGGELGNVRVRGIRGQQALGFCRLMVGIELTLHPQPQGNEISVLEWSGDVQVKASNDPPWYVGRLLPMNPLGVIRASQHVQTPQLEFEVELDRYRLEAIEEIRQGADLTFTVRLWARVRSVSGELEDIPHAESYRANQGTWVEVLGQLGYARTMLIEVPLVDAQTFPEMADALAHLAIAQREMVRGNYREAVGCCRDVLESLSTALDDHDDKDPQIQGLFENTRQMDKAARLRIVRRALKVLTHPARHADAIAARIDWDRIDATSMLSMVAAVVQLAGSRQ